ncbi:EAL domain-containing protein [Alteromonas gracilis]|uniref:EAL domain-containing protein n=1 Tax=Alteromonas gracilis TaxID=1479524 RepID=UPI0037367C8D
MRRFSYLLLLSLIISFPTVASPRLSNPVFQSLSTKNGLPQDIVNDIAINKDGFVWIATEGGLARWDGVSTKRITGQDNALIDASVYRLALQDTDALWFSVYGRGVYYLDLATQDIVQIKPTHYRNIEGFVQHAETFHWHTPSQLIIALSEEIQQFDTNTKQLSSIATLPTSLLESNQSIRAAITIEDTLLVATTSGVFTKSVNDKNQPLTPLDYLGEVEENLDNANAKFLLLDDKNRVWISTVLGVFVASKQDFLAQVRGEKDNVFKQVVSDRNVWTLVQYKDNAFWMGTNKGLFQLTKTADRWQYEHILEPHNGFTEISDKKITAIAKDESDNLWLSSVYAGALYFGVKSADIFTIQNDRADGSSSLTSHVVWAFAETEPNKLWVGTENGLNHYDFTTMESVKYLYEESEKATVGEGAVDKILPTSSGKLFLDTYDGIRIFDPETGEANYPKVTEGGEESIFDAFGAGMMLTNAGDLYFIGNEGFVKYNVDTKVVSYLELDPRVFDINFSIGFLGESKYHGNRLFLATEGGVWLIDPVTFQHELVYRFSEQQRGRDRSISSWIIDDTGVLWLAYSGVGLIGIDADTFEPLYNLNDTNILLSNIVYGLQKDESGNIWFSSHKGLHKYDPATGQIKNFIYGRELSVSEFNQGASLKLDDGRFAYGSTSGAVVFSASQLESLDAGKSLLSKQTAITEVSVDNRSLNQPLKNLSGHHFDLDYEDYGLTIHFSSLAMSGVGKVKYYYKLLNGDRIVTEGITDDAKITFANIEPGDYVFSVAPTPGSFDYNVLPAEITLSMPYAPLRSPLAYTIYSTLIVGLFVAYLLSRQRQVFRLEKAQQQVTLFSDAFRQTRDWVLIFDKEKRLVAANPAFEHVFGLNNKEPLPKQLARLYLRYPNLNRHLSGKLPDMQGGDFWKDEAVIDGADGKRYDVLIDITAVSGESNAADHYLIVISDITEQKNAERKLLKIATYDSLTGLVNRTLLLDRLEHAIGLARHNEHRVAVMFVDLDRFKGINDSLGHDYGDKLLRIVANRMRNLVAESGTVARLGGDEFVIVIEEVTGEDDLSSFVAQIIESVETPISLAEEVLRVSCSIGVAFYPEDASEPAELIKQADVAMYSAKKDALCGFTYFTSDMNERAKTRLQLENKVKRAYSDGGFFNHYQPIIDARTHSTIGVELLLRGKLDDEPLYPDQFIPVLEELKYIIEVTRQAMRRAAQDLASWYKQGFTGYVSINLSALHFKTEFDLGSVLTLLEEFDLPKEAFRFEITEGVLMDDSDNALRQIKRFVGEGFVLALDDFGTGYSSLSYLKRYPLSVLKIDKSFVNEMAPGNANEALVATTIALADNLNMSCVAEGVETQSQVEELIEKSCYYHQGYFYAKPCDADEVTPLLFKSWN